MRTHRRVGFSLTELLIVVVMIVLVSVVALPKTKVISERLNVEAARREVTAAIAVGRAAAIQKGRPATVIFSKNAVTVYATAASGGQFKVLGPIYLDTLFKVTLTLSNAADSVISFEGRGFASPKLPGTAHYILSGLVKKDTVCVTASGQLIPRGCVL